MHCSSVSAMKVEATSKKRTCEKCVVDVFSVHVEQERSDLETILVLVRGCTRLRYLYSTEFKLSESRLRSMHIDAPVWSSGFLSEHQF